MLQPSGRNWTYNGMLLHTIPLPLKLQSADVDIRLAPARPDDLAEARKVCGPIDERPARQWVVCDVVAEFEILRTEQRAEPFGFWAAFPIRACDDPASYVTRFSVESDGNQSPSPEKLANYKPYRFVYVTEDDPSKTLARLRKAANFPTYEGRYWFCRVSSDRLRQRVTYRLLLPADGGEAFFRYVLRSGGEWSEPLGRETVTVSADEPMRIRPLASKSLEPLHSETGKWAWNLRQVRPDDDIRLAVATDGRGESSGSGFAGLASLGFLGEGDNLMYWALGVFGAAALGFVLYIWTKSPRWAR